MDFGYVTISSHDADRLTQFYGDLTGQPVTMNEGAYTILGDGNGTRLAFQRVAAGQPFVPVHVDLRVADLAAASEQVLTAGGRVGAEFAELGARWRQAFDPDGNVFCLMASGELSAAE
jgi:predicted enzyme related to lactoylglutathione lyase